MNYQELQTSVMRYFGDMSRPAAQTRNGLLSLADECQSLAATLGNAELAPSTEDAYRTRKDGVGDTTRC